MADHAELKRAAQRIVEVQTSQDTPIGKMFDEFEALASPEAVLALFAENESLRGSCKAMGSDMGKLTRERNAFRAKSENLKAENAGLHTGYKAYEQVNAELRAEVEDASLEIEQLKFALEMHETCSVDDEAVRTENKELRKNADKWKTVERAMTQLQSDEQGAAIWSACSRILISVASGLNSGRSVVTEEGVTSDGVEIGDWRVTVERIDAAMGQGEQS